MNNEELKKTIEEMRSQIKAKPENADKTEDEIDELMLDGFFKSYTEGEMPKEDLEAIAGEMGYEFTEDFDAEEEVPFEGKGDGEGEKSEAEAEGDLENTRTIEPGESVEEFKEKIEDVKEGEDSEEESEMSEDEEREKASELFRMNLKK